MDGQAQVVDFPPRTAIAPASTPASRPAPRMLAAVDLGSNSFRMVIARVVGGEIHPLDRLRQGVRLAECLDERQRLTPEGERRALACLLMFGQRLRDFPQGSVRAVGTNTLRKARKKKRFLKRAEAALGHPIEIISGQEEARLIFLGASHSLSGDTDRCLVVDIGGGSTECIVGDAFEPARAESLYMGCVSWTMKYFPGGKITAKRMRDAQIAARLELQPMAADFRALGWDRCAGTSGTIQAAAELLRQNGWSEQGITLAGLERLRKTIVAADHVDALRLEGLKTDRAKVLPGGIAILIAAFQSLEIERMLVASGALREGVLYDLLGRLQHEDVRDRTIQRFIEQYHVDVAQARRVAATARRCLDQVADGWKLDRETCRAYLAWGARLHEIGIAISHSGFHKHGAYLIDHSNMAGFSFQDQRILSLMVRGVRRKIPVELYDTLPKSRARVALRLTVLLRLASLLNRSRSPRALPDFTLEAKKRKLTLRLPPGWLEQQPLTAADLERERGYLEAAKIKLRVRELAAG